MSTEPKFQRYVSRRDGKQQTFDVALGATASSFWVRRVGAAPGAEAQAGSETTSVTTPVASGTSAVGPEVPGSPGAPFEVSWYTIGHGRVLLRIDGRVRIARIVQSSPTEFLIEMGGRLFPVRADDEITARALHHKSAAARATGPVALLAPMPGTVVNVLVDEGEAVVQGQAVLVMEAMKMQNELAAPISGRVRGLKVHSGQAVEARARLCEIVPE